MKAGAAGGSTGVGGARRRTSVAGGSTSTSVAAPPADARDEAPGPGPAAGTTGARCSGTSTRVRCVIAGRPRAPSRPRPRTRSAVRRGRVRHPPQTWRNVAGIGLRRPARRRARRRAVGGVARRRGGRRARTGRGRRRREAARPGDAQPPARPATQAATISRMPRLDQASALHCIGAPCAGSLAGEHAGSRRLPPHRPGHRVRRVEGRLAGRGGPDAPCSVGDRATCWRTPGSSCCRVLRSVAVAVVNAVAGKSASPDGLADRC